MKLEFQNISFSYESSRPLLKNLSFHADASEVLLVIGQNGVGKSTMLKLANGILKPSSGRVMVGDLDTATNRTSRLAREICVTFQNPADQIFAPTVAGEVEFAPRNLGRPDAEQLAKEALHLCGLSDLAAHHPYDLPPAKRKLLTVASAVASGAPLLAFDEPSAGLSQLETSDLENILRELKRNNRGLVVVSHDIGLFLEYASRVMVLKQGETIFAGKPDELTTNEEYLRRAGLRLPVARRVSRMIVRYDSPPGKEPGR